MAATRKKFILRRVFDSLVTGSDGRQLDSIYALFVLAILFFAVVLLYNLCFNWWMAPNEWGDFFGGVLTPILTFLTFVGLLVTIILQQTELKESREEFKRSADALVGQNEAIDRQTLDSAFLQMLTVHNNIVNSIDLVSPGTAGKVTRGRDCFGVFSYRLHAQFRGVVGGGRSVESLEAIKIAYSSFWNSNQSELGHYFRFLYNMVRFLKENSSTKPYHMRMLRAQLSNNELLLLFYNCLGEHGGKFKTLAEEFHLFDNLPSDLIFDPAHKAFYAPAAFGTESVED